KLLVSWGPLVIAALLAGSLLAPLRCAAPSATPWSVGLFVLDNANILETESQCGRRRKISALAMMVIRRTFCTGSQIIVASNPTPAIPTIKKANAAASYSNQYLCARMKCILHRGMGEHQLSMDN